MSERSDRAIELARVCGVAWLGSGQQKEAMRAFYAAAHADGAREGAKECAAQIMALPVVKWDSPTESSDFYRGHKQGELLMRKKAADFIKKVARNANT